MAIAFSLHVLSAVVTLAATPLYFAAGGNKEAAYWCLYIGSFIFSLANGACEAVINPLTATLFPRPRRTGSTSSTPAGRAAWSSAP